MLTMKKPSISDRLPLRYEALAAETNFYSAYDWCLDPHLTIGDAVEHLLEEVGKLPSIPEGWQTGEVATNIFLLSCSVLNGIEEHLRGHTLRMPARLARTRLGRAAMWTTERVAEAGTRRSRKHICRWKEAWQDGQDAFFAVVCRRESDPALLIHAAQQFSETLRSPIPADLRSLRLGVPSAFSRLDLTHFDVLALGGRLMRQYPDKSHPIVLLGLRTAGTYFSALLRSSLKSEGYSRVASLTLQPVKGPCRRERNELTRYAEQGFTVVIVDDPPHTGGSICLAVDIARQSRFDLARIKVLVPAHPAAHSWADSLPSQLVITLEPERWQRQLLLDPPNVENRLAEYFAQQGFSSVRVVGGSKADELNARLQSRAERGATLKRIFEIQLRKPEGKIETRYVLAKSVGLGYLGYAAFLTAHRLSGFVPPLLGLRDGILYTEWLPQQPDPENIRSRASWIDTTASYVAARTKLLGLSKSRAPGKAVHENGLELLAKSLSRACGHIVFDIPICSWIQQQFYQLHCPYPTLIDGNMDCAHWIEGEAGPLKTGYYGHGLGKTQLNVIDPAYDLAETVLSLALSPEEEDRLIDQYILHSGDAGVRKRLFINKLLAGLWTINAAQEQLFGVSQSRGQQQAQHRRFISAWDFLTVQTARFCGTHCRQSQPAFWRSPLVMLDVDGVIDRRIFGFPCTTVAGIEALSLLATRGYSVALNTARSADEVKSYCEAYGLAGGVAENGAYLWDAVANRGQCLIDQESMAQLDELRKALRRTPGVFVDERHRYSIRAYMIEKKSPSSLVRLLNSIRSFDVGDGAPTPLPTLLVSHLLAALRLDRLSFHHTTIDTAVIAKGIDKGTGLMAVRNRLLGARAEIIAVGDSKSDLPMFRAATRSFATAQIRGLRGLGLLGCTVSRYRNQRGLLDIVRTLAECGPGSDRFRLEKVPTGETLFLDLLRAADHLDVRTLTRMLLHRASFRIFLR